MIRPLFVSSAGYLVAGVSLLIAVDGYLEVEGVIEETARYLADEGEPEVEVIPDTQEEVMDQK